MKSAKVDQMLFWDAMFKIVKYLEAMFKIVKYLEAMFKIVKYLGIMKREKVIKLLKSDKIVGATKFFCKINEESKRIMREIVFCDFSLTGG